MAEDKITIYGELESGVPGGVVMSLKKSVTYEELLNLRNQSRLQPGMQYRITDYVTVCRKDTTNFISAGNVFDVVVTADSSSTLKEEASVMHREGDTYFAHCNLAEWKIKYCLDNDTLRFNWVPGDEAEAAMFDGYAYQRKPEEDKTIGNYTYIAWYNANNTSAPLVYSLFTDPKPNRCVAFFWDSLYSEMVGEATFGVYREAVRHAKGVIYWMRDEWDNECYYDFKNIRFKTEVICDTLQKPSLPGPVGDYCYTFETGPINIGDASVSDFYEVKNNVIKACRGLNFIVLYGSSSFNSFDEDCRFIYLKGSTFNKFGPLTERSYCLELHYNVFEGNNSGISILPGCESNTFKTYTTNIELGMLCKNNVFDNGSNNISLEDFSSRNYFGKSSSNIFLGPYSCDNHFGNAVTRVTFYDSRTTDPIKPRLSYVCNNYFESGVRNVSIYCNVITTADNMLQNLYVYTGEYHGAFENDIATGQIKVTILPTAGGEHIIQYGFGAIVPHAPSSEETAMVLEANSAGVFTWRPESLLAKRLLQSYKNVEFFDGIKDGVLANIVEAVSAMKIDGIYYYKDRKCFVAKSGDNFYMSWGTMQSTVHDYNEGNLARMDRIFEVEDTRYCFNGEDLVLYES